jgi:hypothetical protein
MIIIIEFTACEFFLSGKPSDTKKILFNNEIESESEKK